MARFVMLLAMTAVRARCFPKRLDDYLQRG